jgi:integrase
MRTVPCAGSMGHKGFQAKQRRRPTIEKRTVVPRRPKNADVRPREFFTPDEVERLIAAAKKDTRRHTHRDATMILMAYRHGLRASELIGVRWDMLDLEQGTLE